MEAHELDELARQYPLPDDVPDATLQKNEVAQFFGVSIPTIDAWLRQGMPAMSEGANGRAWEFRAAHVWAWREAQRAEEETRSEEARAAIEAMRLRLVDGKAGDSIRALPPKERRDLYEVELAHRKLMAESNSLIERQVVRELLEDLFSLFRDGVTAHSDRLERDGALKGEQIELVDQYGEELLEQLGRRIEEFFSARPVTDRATRGEADLFKQ